MRGPRRSRGAGAPDPHNLARDDANFYASIMRAILRGFAWFLGSIVLAAIVLRATVFDVWTVTEAARAKGLPESANDLAAGDVVIVLRDGKPLAGNVAKCAAADGKSTYAMRVSPAPVGSSDPDDLPKPARIAAPRNPPPKRARNTTRGGREKDRPSAASTPTPASAPTEQPAAPKETAEATTCRRVVFRLWGEKGPQDPERRFSIVD